MRLHENKILDSGFWTYTNKTATYTSTKDHPNRIAANDGIVYYTTKDGDYNTTDGYFNVYENGQSKVNGVYTQKDTYHDIAWVSTPKMRAACCPLPLLSCEFSSFTPSQLWISMNDTYGKLYPLVKCPPVAAASSNSCGGFGTCDMTTGICNTCTCENGWAGAICQPPTCAIPCQNGGTCSGPNTCTCGRVRSAKHSLETKARAR